MTKLSENAFRDVNIAYANELSMICNELNIDHNEVIELANFHPRVNILNPGCGVGGHCIAVDPWFIASAVPNLSLLIQSSRKVNENKKNWSYDQIVKNIKLLETKLQKHPVIGCLGLAYKNDIGDLRESPSEKIVLQLIKEGFDILACEPNLDKHSKIKLYDINKVLRESDLIVIFVPHCEFKKIDFIDYRVIDLCGVTLKK